MRKAQKRQAEEMIKLLGCAHGEMKTALEKKDRTRALELLEQSQEAAIRLGTLIDQTEGEGTSTVSKLEDYCELVYRIYEEIEKHSSADVDKAYKSLREMLASIENSVKNEIKVRMEAVFLPYKAAMWDSLESIWRAAYEDPGCDAYVIPIPYFDKNPDGSFCEMHYEGGLYPDYVPVTHYEAYDFESRRPDMIFIHNPYDEYNHVTSVHPFFYSGNLKRFTEKLVYIPYFILNDVEPDNQKAVEKIQHFCTVMGVVNADAVIVQSENMRQIYINTLTELMGENTRACWERKILGLGSPKSDRVAQTKREDLQIPEPWREIITKPDGSRKKIILYNTGVDALLKQGDLMLKKIRDVLRIFEENRKEAALLWRPHPLIRATIASMRPQLWKEYEEIVQKYCKEGWGIYDDTADLERAIALCDAYYGDGSSIVKLCQEAGKPVMIQNVEIMEGNDS